MAQGVAKYEQGGYDLIGYGGMGSDTPIADVIRIKADPVLSKQLHFINKVRTIWVQYAFGRADSVFKGDLERAGARPAPGVFARDRPRPDGQRRLRQRHHLLG